MSQSVLLAFAVFPAPQEVQKLEPAAAYPFSQILQYAAPKSAYVPAPQDLQLLLSLSNTVPGLQLRQVVKSFEETFPTSQDL